MRYEEVIKGLISSVKPDDPDAAFKKLQIKRWSHLWWMLADCQSHLDLFIQVLSDETCWDKTEDFYKIKINVNQRYNGSDSRSVDIYFPTPINESQLSLDNGILSVNRIRLEQIPQQTRLYFGPMGPQQQILSVKALQDTLSQAAPERIRRRRRQLLGIENIPFAAQRTHRNPQQIPDMPSSASRSTPWITTLWKGLLGILPTASSPPLPQPPVSLSPQEYTASHLQGGLQLLDLVIRKWTGKKYSPPALTQNVDNQPRTAAAELAYAAYCPRLLKLQQSLTAEIHESHATTPQEPWLAYPLPTTDTHNLTRQLT